MFLSLPSLILHFRFSNRALISYFKFHNKAQTPEPKEARHLNQHLWEVYLNLKITLKFENVARAHVKIDRCLIFYQPSQDHFPKALLSSSLTFSRMHDAYIKSNLKVPCSLVHLISLLSVYLDSSQIRSLTAA